MALRTHQNGLPLPNLGLYHTLNEACLDWACKWGLPLAYVVTQSSEVAERILAEAMLGVLATAQANNFGISEAVLRFGALVYELSLKQAFRGYCHDEFMRQAPAVRAAVVLKAKGHLSRIQIANILGATLDQVETHLEVGRLGFTKGRSWLKNATPRRQLDDAHYVSPCPEWHEGRLFAQYIENEMSPEDVRRHHRHFLECPVCRTNLLGFKNTYTDWIASLPEVVLTKDTTRYLARMSREVSKAKIFTQQKAVGAASTSAPILVQFADSLLRPSLTRGIIKVLEGRTNQLVILIFILAVALYHLTQ